MSMCLFSGLIVLWGPQKQRSAVKGCIDGESRCPNAGMGMMEQRKKKVPVFLRQAIRQGIGVTIAVLLGYAIADTLGGAPLLVLSFTVNAHGQAEAHRIAVCPCQHIFPIQWGAAVRSLHGGSGRSHASYVV